MFSLTSSHKFYMCKEPADMRKSFDGLSGMVREHFELDPANGAVYVFLNKPRDRIKLLHWERGGFTLYYKRLEKGVFERPLGSDTNQITWSTLMMIVEGIKLDYLRKKDRFCG